MHKRFRHVRRKNDKGIFRTDITINDFANSDPSKLSGNREKKGTTSTTLHKKAMSKEVEQLSWFEKDIDQFDLDLQSENTEDKGSEEEVVDEIVHQVRVKKTKKRKDTDNNGITYPIDVWILLSGYILPQYIGVFAGICHGANTVTHTVQFWKTIIRRFYRDDPGVPDHLRITSLDSIHGLRTKTIQLLYHIYKPLQDRIKTTVPFENEPHILVGQRCLLTWHKKVKSMWKFYFKFRKGDKIDLSSNRRRSIDSPDFERWHQDLTYNPDDRCSVLEVTCPNFVPQPVVMGLILNRVYFNVSSGSMRYHRLKLILDSNFKVTTVKNQMSMMELLIDPVYEVRVYPWWDPNFMVSHSIMENEP